jgi:hypothetical protein
MRLTTVIITIGVLLSVMIGGAAVVGADQAFEITTTSPDPIDVPSRTAEINDQNSFQIDSITQADVGDSVTIEVTSQEPVSVSIQNQSGGTFTPVRTIGSVDDGASRSVPLEDNDRNDLSPGTYVLLINDGTENVDVQPLVIQGFEVTNFDTDSTVESGETVTVEASIDKINPEASDPNRIEFVLANDTTNRTVTNTNFDGDSQSYSETISTDGLDGDVYDIYINVRGNDQITGFQGPSPSDGSEREVLGMSRAEVTNVTEGVEQFDSDNDGDISIVELGDAGEAFAAGEISIRTLGDVGAVFASG